MDAKQVVEIFVEQGLITEDDGANLLLQASNSESPIEQILVDNGIVSERGFEKTIADSIGDGASRALVKDVLETLATVGHKELKKNGTFILPGFAKFVVVKKPATKARKGINPFTGDEIMIKAKPASRAVRIRPLKALKDAL